MLAHGAGPVGVELGVEGFDADALLPGEVVRLVRVGGEVVELGLAGFVLGRGDDQFPAVGEDPAPAETGGGVVLIDEVVRETFAEDRGAGGDGARVGEIDAGEVARRGDAAGLENGREEIERAHGGVAGAGREGAGPAEHEGRAQAAVVGRLFGLRRVAGGLGLGDPAVVGDVDDEGVLREAGAIEVGKEFSAGFVEPLDHGPVFGDAFAGRLGAVLGEEALGWSMRVVRHQRRVPDEERFLLLLRFRDESSDGLQGLAADGEAFVAVAAASGHAGGEAAVRVISEPPLAGLETHVASLAQEAGERGPSREITHHARATRLEGRTFDELVLGHLLRFGRVVAGDAVLVRVAPGDDAREARATQAGRDITVAKGEALAREAIEVRRLYLRVAHEAVVAPVLIVGDDHDDIGRSGKRAETQRKKKQTEPRFKVEEHGQGGGGGGNA